MKNKWKLLVVFIIIILINPKIFTTISESFKGKSIKIDNLKSFNIDRNFKYIEYKSNLVFYEKGAIKGINKNGEETFSLDLGIKNPILSSNKYIDILDQEKNIVYSIDEKGKIIIKKTMKKEGLMYKSLDNDCYVYIFTKDKKNIANIYDFEFKIIKSIELDGMLTDIDYNSNQIYICTLKIDKSLESKISSYDYNGNLNDIRELKESILLNLDINKNNLYLIEKNKISKVDKNLKVIEQFNIDDLKSYSNINNEELYVVENDGDILFIKNNKAEKININEKNIKKIANIGDSFIAFTNNKALNSKGKEIKKFDGNIKDVAILNNKLLCIILENSMQILSIK